MFEVSKNIRKRFKITSAKNNFDHSSIQIEAVFRTEAKIEAVLYTSYLLTYHDV